MNMYTIKRLLWGPVYIMKNNKISLKLDKEVNLTLTKYFHPYTMCQIFKL